MLSSAKYLGTTLNTSANSFMIAPVLLLAPLAAVLDTHASSARELGRVCTVCAQLSLCQVYAVILPAGSVLAGTLCLELLSVHR